MKFHLVYDVGNILISVTVQVQVIAEGFRAGPVASRTICTWSRWSAGRRGLSAVAVECRWSFFERRPRRIFCGWCGRSSRWRRLTKRKRRQGGTQGRFVRMTIFCVALSSYHCQLQRLRWATWRHQRRKEVRVRFFRSNRNGTAGPSSERQRQWRTAAVSVSLAQRLNTTEATFSISSLIHFRNDWIHAS